MYVAWHLVSFLYFDFKLFKMFYIACDVSTNERNLSVSRFHDEKSNWDLSIQKSKLPNKFDIFVKKFRLDSLKNYFR